MPCLGLKPWTSRLWSERAVNWAILPNENLRKIMKIYIWFVVQQMYVSLTYLFNTHYHTLLNTASRTVWPPQTTLYDQLWRHVGPTMFVNLTPVSLLFRVKSIIQWVAFIIVYWLCFHKGTFGLPRFVMTFLFMKPNRVNFAWGCFITLSNRYSQKRLIFLENGKLDSFLLSKWEKQ